MNMKYMHLALILEVVCHAKNWCTTGHTNLIKAYKFKFKYFCIFID